MIFQIERIKIFINAFNVFITIPLPPAKDLTKAIKRSRGLFLLTVLNNTSWYRKHYGGIDHEPAGHTGTSFRITNN